MRKPSRNEIMVSILALLVVVAVVVALRPGEVRPPASTSGYYAGPMMNKNRTVYADDNGHVVPPPDGAPKPGKDRLANLEP